MTGTSVSGTPVCKAHAETHSKRSPQHVPELCHTLPIFVHCTLSRADPSQQDRCECYPYCRAAVKPLNNVMEVMASFQTEPGKGRKLLEKDFLKLNIGRQTGRVRFGGFAKPVRHTPSAQILFGLFPVQVAFSFRVSGRRTWCVVHLFDGSHRGVTGLAKEASSSRGVRS
jgi:hypothetical protein